MASPILICNGHADQDLLEKELFDFKFKPATLRVKVTTFLLFSVFYVHYLYGANIDKIN